MIQRTLLRQSRALCNRTRPTDIFAPNSTPAHVSTTLHAAARAGVSPRWYSDSAKTESETKKEGDEAAPAEDPKQKELAAKTKEVVELKDKYLRSVADYRNLQERTRREVQAAKDFALQKFAKDLVESVDNFDLALANVPADKISSSSDDHKDLRQLHGGLKMTETILMNTLKKHGLERFDPAEKGEKFDPNLHEATFMTPQPDKQDGTVFHTTQKGFMLNGRVLRAAKVGVVRNS